MQIEYEATFSNINKDEIRARLKQAGAKLVKPEFLQKRVNFYPPKEKRNAPGWLRVRDEGDKITMSFKAEIGDNIRGQKEICLEVNNFNLAVDFLSTILEQKAYQETKRELWILDSAEICIDEWPYLEPLVEVEGDSEGHVKKVCKKLKLDYKEAVFGPITSLYKEKYNLSSRIINNQIPRITFNDPNPFI